jgi:Putative auto-transporter adhesin, head GIN domain
MTIAPAPIHHRHVTPLLTAFVLGALLSAAVIGIVLAVRNGSISSSSTLRGSGIARTEIRHVGPFTAVDLAGANTVTVRVGGPRTVTVRGDDNLVSDVTTTVSAGRLVVDQSRSFSTRSPMSVEVGVPSLDSVRLSGSGILTVDGVRAKSFTVDVPGSGVLAVAGTVSSLNAALSGSGDVRLQDLAAQDVTAHLAGSGRLQVNATKSLDARVSGSGAIFYSGEPAKLTEQITGNGAILKG